jgi:hypothetical protein
MFESTLILLGQLTGFYLLVILAIKLFGAKLKVTERTGVSQMLLSWFLGCLPISGRQVAVTACIQPLPAKRSSISAVITYLGCHHYYLWSPIEPAVLLILASTGIIYSSFLLMTLPYLLVYVLVYLLIALRYKKDENQYLYLNVPCVNKKLFITIAKTFGWVIVASVIGTIIKKYIPTNLITNEHIKILFMFLAFLFGFASGSSKQCAVTAILFSSVFTLQLIGMFYCIGLAGYLLSPLHACVIFSLKHNQVKFYNFAKFIVPIILGFFALGVI